MLLSVPVPGTAVYNQAFLNADITIAPSTANFTILSSGSLAMTGRRTRVIFTAGVGISGTTNTLRLGTFSLLQDGVVQRAVEVQLPADEAGAGVYRQVVHIEFDLVPTPGAHTYTVAWKTGANTTMAIPATDPTTGYGNLIVQELTAGTTFVSPITSLLKLGCVQANDMKSLAQAIRNDFAAKLAINAGMEFVDVQLEGGGAGATWQAMLLYQLPTTPAGSVSYPLVSTLSVGCAVALEPITNEQAVAAIWGATDSELIAWSGAGAGAGALFAEVFMYIPGEGEGFAESFSGRTEAAFVGPTLARQDRKPPALTPAKKATGVTFPRATVAGRTSSKATSNKVRKV